MRCKACNRIMTDEEIAIDDELCAECLKCVESPWIVEEEEEPYEY